MGTRSKDQISPRIYPWWLILVGFVFGVIVTLIVTGGSRPTFANGSDYSQEYGPGAMQVVCDDATPVAIPTSVSYFPQSSTLDPLLVMATQMVIEATQTADASMRTRCVNLAQTATAMVIEATPQAPAR